MNRFLIKYLVKALRPFEANLLVTMCGDLCWVNIAMRSGHFDLPLKASLAVCYTLTSTVKYCQGKYGRGFQCKVIPMYGTCNPVDRCLTFVCTRGKQMTYKYLNNVVNNDIFLRRLYTPHEKWIFPVFLLFDLLNDFWKNLRWLFNNFIGPNNSYALGMKIFVKVHMGYGKTPGRGSPSFVIFQVAYGEIAII